MICGASHRCFVGYALASTAIVGLFSTAMGQEAHAIRGSTVEGEVFEEVVSTSDSSQRYALLLPPDYDPSTRHPLLVVLDPRGRAVHGLRRFTSAVRLGWIVMSSYNTRSDTPTPSTNERALEAMLVDAQEHLAVHTERIYLAGFSGTARIGWQLAGILHPHVAGLIGVGAGIPDVMRAQLRAGAVKLPRHFAFWGGAGSLDFNYEEVHAAAAILDELRLPHHRVVSYPGRHALLPQVQAEEAVAWLELVAVKEGLGDARKAWVDSLKNSWSNRAHETLLHGDTVKALEQWRTISSAFAGLTSVEDAKSRVRALAGTDATVRHGAIRKQQRAEHSAFMDRVWAIASQLKYDEPPPDAQWIARELRLEELRRREQGDTLADARQAGRLLENVHVQMSFYVPQYALQHEQPHGALIALEVAERARPGSARVCLFRARAHAMAGKVDEAFDALRCYLDDQAVPTEPLQHDRWLAPLRADPRWRDEITDSTAPDSSPSG